MVPKLLFDICNCENFKSLTNGPNIGLPCINPCCEIVNFQRLHGAIDTNDFQIPEPWSGDICNAPILFISSNPGYSITELYPLSTWPSPIIADFFINRFKDRGQDHSWVYNSSLLNKNGTRGKTVKYWSCIKKRAEELLDRIAVPGIDYCNTELVHCKSDNQIGVRRALVECTNRFNSGLITISGAKIIIGFGSFVKTFFNGASNINGVPIFYLPHPNARIPKTFAKLYTELEIENIRKKIESEEFYQKKIELSDCVLPTDNEVKEFIDSQIASYKNGLTNL